MKTHGANSFIYVKLSDLQKYLGGDCPIKISKKWFNNLGFNTIIKGIEQPETETIEPNQDKIQFTLNQ